MKMNRNLSRYIDRFFREFDDEARDSLEGEGTCSAPPVESFRQNGSFVVKVDLPGIDPQDVHLTFEQNCLMIEGERKRSAGVDESSLMHEEVCYGPFRRTLHVPEGIKSDQIHADYHNGVLEISAPVEEKYLPKRIEVQVEKS